MRNGMFDVSVTVHGKPIREYEHNGKTYVEGRKGSDFSISIRNFSSSRVLAVVSVDGLDVMLGKTADYHTAGGYVIAANDKIVIPGWRLDNSEVAKFVFKDADGSYSKESGHGTQNVGVIGVAIYAELVQNFTFTPYTWYSLKPIVYGSTTTNNTGPNWSYTHTSGGLGGGRCSGLSGESFSACGDVPVTNFCCSQQVSSASAGSISDPELGVAEGADVATRCSGKIGTGFGEAKTSMVANVSFSKSSYDPIALLSIYYDSFSRLREAGIIKNRQEVCSNPNPFPRNGHGCTPPKSWNR